MIKIDQETGVGVQPSYDLSHIQRLVRPSVYRASLMQLEVTEKMSNSEVLGWNTPPKHTVVHHMPSSVESTLASLPYDDLYLPSCIYGAVDGESPLRAFTSSEL